MLLESNTLVGRDRELSRLDSALDLAETGRGGFVLLTGEAGIGKTALAEAASAAAAQRGFEVTWGRATVHAGAPPYWILNEALAPLLETEAAGEMIPSAGLFDIIPEARHMRPNLAPVEFADPEAAQFGASRALSQFLTRLSRSRPLMLVLDDLQDADIATLRALQVLARDLRRHSILAIGTFRERDWSDRPGQREILLTLLREGESIAVEPLRREHTAELLRRNATADEKLVERVHEATGGNALFVCELSRMLSDARGDDEELPLPLGVRELVRHRLDALDAASVAAIRAAAVLGLDSSQDEIEAMVGHIVPADTDLLQIKAGRARFSHGLVREAVYRTLGDDESRTLHQLAAQAVEQNDRSSARLARLAYHLTRCGPASSEAACRATLNAAAHAVDRGGYDDAVAMLEALFRRLPDSIAPSLRLDVQIETARAHYLCGNPERGRELADEAAALSRELGDPRRFGEVALVRGSTFAFGYPANALVAALQEALDWLGDDRQQLALRARLLGRLAAAQQPSDDPYATAEAGLAAIELARQTGDDAVLLEVLHTAMAAVVEYAAPARRQTLNRECLRLARARGNVTIQWRALTRLLFDAFELADLIDADHVITELHQLTANLGQDRFRRVLAMARAMRALFLGDLLAAERARRDAEAMGEGPADAFYLTLHMLGVHRTVQDIEALAATGRALCQEVAAQGFGEYVATLSLSIAASTGDVESVRKSLQGGVPLRFLQERVLGVCLARVSEALTLEEARVVYDWFAPHAGELVSGGATAYFAEGPYDLALARLASRLGEHEQAVEHADDAIALLRAIGGTPHLILALADGARIRRARGGPEDARIAARLLSEAREAAETLGAPGLVSYVGRADASSEASPHTSDGPAELTLTRNDASSWFLTAGARRLQLRHNVGLEVLESLMRRPGQEIHVLELIGAEEPAAQSRSLGDAIDPHAKAEYKRRLDELGEEIEEARARGQVGRAQALESERHWLVKELAAAFGLGGKARPVGSSAEKARVTVNRRLRRAIDRIREQDPEIAEILDASVKTGTYCSYAPLPLTVVTM